MTESKDLSQKKQILFVTRPLCPPWDEASKNFAYNLAKHLDTHRITVMTSCKLETLPANVSQVKTYTKGVFDLSQKVLCVLHQIKDQKKYALFHYLFTPTKFNTTIVRAITQKFNKKSIQTVATLRDDMYTDAELKKLLFADLIVTYTKYAYNKLDLLGFTNIAQIYPGIDLETYSPQPKDQELMKKWSLNQDDVIVSYPGEYVRLGATDTIINAFVELWSDPANHHIKYICACRIKNNADAAKKNRIIERLRSVGHLDKVTFTDTFSQMDKIYNLSDIVLFPVENMKGKFDVPLAMIEPYACKKPVITTDLEILEEFSSPEFNVIIPKHNEEALVNAIKDLAHNTEKRTQLGENAYEFVHKTFNITHIVKKYDKLYDRIQNED